MKLVDEQRAAGVSYKTILGIDELPLARIKRIMKMESCDPAPRQISADVLPLMAYAGKLFVGLVTTLAWQNTLYEGRNTLQYKDIKAAILSSKIFDYQIDVLDKFERELAANKNQKSQHDQLRTIMPAPHDTYDGIPSSRGPIPTDHPWQCMAAPTGAPPLPVARQLSHAAGQEFESQEPLFGTDDGLSVLLPARQCLSTVRPTGPQDRYLQADAEQALLDALDEDHGDIDAGVLFDSLF